MKNITKLLLGLTLLMVFAVSCAKGGNDGEKDSKGNVEKVTITTSKGDVEVPVKPKKVVVFDYGVLDIMNELGIEAEIGTAVQNLPASLEKYKKSLDAGSLHEPNFEKLNEFAPDLIIISARQEKSYDELSKIAPTLYMGVNPDKYIASVYENIRTIGKIFGKEKEADEKVAELTKEVEEVKGLTAKFDKKVLMALTNDGKISAYGAGSRFGFVFTDLGLKSVDEKIKVSTHGQEINYEYIAEKNPDIIYYVDRAKIAGGSKDGGDVLKNSLVDGTNAGKSGKIVALDPVTWYIVAGGFNSTKTQLNEIKASLK